jgi:hypothetical protein
VSGDLSLGLFGGDVRGGLAVVDVLLDVAEEPAHGRLVIVVFLTLEDNLLEPEDELVATFFREVLFGEESLGAILLVNGTIPMFLGNAFLNHTSAKGLRE